LAVQGVELGKSDMFLRLMKVEVPKNLSLVAKSKVDIETKRHIKIIFIDTLKNLTNEHP